MLKGDATVKKKGKHTSQRNNNIETFMLHKINPLTSSGQYENGIECERLLFVFFKKNYCCNVKHTFKQGKKNNCKIECNRKTCLGRASDSPSNLPTNC
jgi:hypothetical protein